MAIMFHTQSIDIVPRLTQLLNIDNFQQELNYLKVGQNKCHLVK